MSLRDFLPKKAVQKKPSKEELAETRRQQDLVKNVIWPIILKHATNVKQAKNILQQLVVGLDAVFMMDVKNYSVKRSGEALETLDLTASMNKGKEFMAEWELVEVLRNETITVSKALIDGMDKEVQRLLDKELIDRPLTELKTEFL